MDSEYQSDSQPNNAGPDDFRPSFKKLTKNQQIYGDFEYAYEPEPTHNIFSSKRDAYEQFKAGATIESYSSEVEVDLPISKPKKRTLQEEEDDKPMLGKFTLNSFLNSLEANEGLREIVEEDEDSSQNKPEGLNEKIILHLQLVKFGEEDQEEEEKVRLEDMNLQSYLKTSRPKQQKIEPKYKTQQEKDLAKDFNQNYGVGFKMLEKMGFKVAKGLGKEQTGIQKPVEAVMKNAFTMKDQAPRKKQRQSESEKEEEETKEISIPQRVFQYRSKDRKINNFLIDLKNTYERLESQIYNCQAQIDSFRKEEELNQSLRCQSQNQVGDLSREIQKLQQLQSNIYSNSQHHPHLALTYKIDLLHVRELYDQLLNADLDTLVKQAKQRIDSCLNLLNKFYIAKARETLRDFEESTGIDSKMRKNVMKGQKQEEVIDLDKEGQVSIGFEDEERMRQFIEAILSRCLLPKVANVLDRFAAIEKVTDLRVIDLLEIAKHFDRRGVLLKEFTSSKVVPKCRAYLQSVSLEDLEAGTAKTPSQVIFPWLTVVSPEDLNLLGFYRRVGGRLWNIQSGALLAIIKPWVKFSTQAELSFLQNLYLAPRLLYEMEQFNISTPKPSLLTGFTQYCELLTFQQREEILENSLMLQVLQAYKQYRGKMQDEELRKWLAKWKKFTDKIAPGFFQGFFREYAIAID